MDLTDFGLPGFSPLRQDDRPVSSDSGSSSDIPFNPPRHPLQRNDGNRASGSTSSQRQPENQRRYTSGTRDETASFERMRRPYSASPENPITRPRSLSDMTNRLDSLHLPDSSETIVLERQRRRYASTTLSPPSTSSNPPQPRRTPEPIPKPPSTSITDLDEILEEGIDVNTLSTPSLLTIMRENGCPLLPGLNEREDLVERVQEMLSFKLSQTTPSGKQPKVKDDDEDECRICNDNVGEYCLVPCGHTGMCLICARQMTDCPFCRMPIRVVQRLFRV